MTDSELANADQTARERAERHYETLATFGDAEMIESTRAELERAMDAELHTVVEANKHKIAGGMAVFVTPLVIAFFAFVLDRLSDVTCDMWSETCRTVSGQLWFLYMGVLAALCYSMYTVYSERGPLAVSVTMTSLVNTAALRVQDHMKAARAHIEDMKEQYLGGAPRGSPSVPAGKAKLNRAGSAPVTESPSNSSAATLRRRSSVRRNVGSPARSKKTE